MKIIVTLQHTSGKTFTVSFRSYAELLSWTKKQDEKRLLWKSQQNLLRNSEQTPSSDIINNVTD
jgi:hypothetical protein